MDDNQDSFLALLDIHNNPINDQIGSFLPTAQTLLRPKTIQATFIKAAKKIMHPYKITKLVSIKKSGMANHGNQQVYKTLSNKLTGEEEAKFY